MAISLHLLLRSVVIFDQENVPSGVNLTFVRRDCGIGDTNVKFTPRVVRFRHLAPIAACPRPNVGVARTTRNDKFLVAFLNLTFARRDCGIGDTNVKFTPRVVRFRHLAPIAPCPQPNVGIARTTRNDKFLVAFLNLTFARGDCGIGDTNVKFTPLELRRRFLNR
jgi:hypothetical protein